MPESPSPTFGVEVCSAWRQELEEVLLTLGFPVSQMVKHPVKLKTVITNLKRDIVKRSFTKIECILFFIIVE